MTSAQVSRRGGRRKLAKRAGVLSVCASVLAVNRLESAVTQTPLAINGWTVGEIYNGPLTTVSFDAKNNVTLYTNTAQYAPAGSGLPTANNRVFTSLSNTNTTFQFQSYSSNDALELNTDPNALYGPSTNPTNAVVTTGTLSLAAQGAYTNLAFLSAAANVAATVTYTLNFQGGTSATGTFSGLDWFNSSSGAINNIGRVASAYESQVTTYRSSIYSAAFYPQLFETDITVPAADQSLLLKNVSFSLGGTGGQWSIFAVSGTVNAVPIYTYTGTDPNYGGSFDITSQNFQLSNGTATTFANGAVALFDDTAAGSHTLTVASGGASPSLTQFNNITSSYTVNGPGSISGLGGLLVSGGGVVTLNNSNSYLGATNVSSGTLIISATASIASTTIFVGTGGILNVQGSIPSSLNLTVNGVANLPGVTTLLSLNGTSTLNLLTAGTPLTIDGGSFSGTLNASGTTLTLAGAGGTLSANFSDGSGTNATNAVIVNSTGTWNLGGSNSYSGGTRLLGGTVSASSSTAFGTGSVSIAGGAIGSSVPITIGNTLTGGALTVANGNILELTSTTNSFTGPITILPTGSSPAATLKIDSPGALGSATSITVGSGGSFEVNDGSGSAGVGATVTITGPGVTSTYANPLPNGPTGALRGGDGQNSIWAGNVNVSGASYIASGADGTLVLTGAISGTGPVTFTGNTDDSNGATIILNPSLGHSNTYTGETRLLPDVNVNVMNGTLLQIGTDNGVSPSSGLNIVTGSQPEFVYFDLNGHNQTVKYLKGGAQTGYAIENTGGSQSTLTVTSGASNVLGTAIQGNIAVVMNDPTGSGNQILSGANTYSGGTTIINGTLSAASANAFGSSPVNLQGGTLGLAANITAGSPIVTSSNFSSFALNQGVGTGGSSVANVSGSTLTLTTTGNNSTANSAFYSTKVPVSDALGFTAKFTYNVTTGYADGMAFVLQNDPRGANAVSNSSGGSLGYAGTNKVTQSAAVEFEIYPFGNSYGTAFGPSGLVPGNAGNPTTSYVNTTPVNIGTKPVTGGYVLDNQPVDVTLVYNGPAQTLAETLYSETEKQTFTTTYTGIDYAALVGGSSAYLGFTAATGGVSSTQIVTNLSYSTNLSSPQSIGNAVVATVGTSAIQLGVTSGSTANGATVGPISVNAGATLNVTATIGSTIRGVLFSPSISIASSSGSFAGKLDLESNDLVVTSTPLTQVTAMLAGGFNAGGWNGQGIASSAAAANSNHLTALGVIVNDNGVGTPLYGQSGTLSTSFDGSSPADGNVLVKYTYYGDANLDGVVDASDYSLIDSGYLTHATGWYNGDFNYDGAVNGSDYTLIDNAFNTQGAALRGNTTSVIAYSTAEIVVVPVPEPTCAGLLSIAIVGLLGRTRERAGSATER